jgi:hypothetical protein
MKLVITTGITVNAPTINGNVYPREVVEQAIESFNKKARKTPVIGGILDRVHIQRVNEEVIQTHELFINDSGLLCARIEILDTEAGNKLKNVLKEGIIGRPLLSIPSYVFAHGDGSKESEEVRDHLVVSVINEITRIQIECESEL